MRISTTRRAGLNLAEVIVIILVIGILTTLLMPSVSSRGPSRRTQCRNNLKQLGLAMHNYVDANGRLPPSGVWDVTDQTKYGEWTDLGNIGSNK